MSFLSWCALLLIGLKLAGLLDWSWGLVLAPIYLPLASVGALVGLLALFAQVSMRDSSSPHQQQAPVPGQREAA